MHWFILTFLFGFFIERGQCLWSKGVVHYAINKKDYDLHSQEIIMSVLEKIQSEICVKFFNTPFNYSAGYQNRLLYITNPDKRKNCSPQLYNFNDTVIDMPIGYRCLNEPDITRLVVEMLRASIKPQVSSHNSFDLVRRFQEQDKKNTTYLLTLIDRNFINSNYYPECANLVEHRPESFRRQMVDGAIMGYNEKFYENKLWPFGIVFYGADRDLVNTEDYLALQDAMSTIEQVSQIVFKYIRLNETLMPKNLLWFVSSGGEDVPMLGFTEGNQTLLLSSMVHGAPGHMSHTLNQLMRTLGVPMMSNRFDRDNYVTINWKAVQKGMEHYLERMPMEAVLKNSDGYPIPYDYRSVTHAPANYFCNDCSLGDHTVIPTQDYLWKKLLTIGHRKDLSPADIEALNLLYNKEYQNRNIGQNYVTYFISI